MSYLNLELEVALIHLLGGFSIFWADEGLDTGPLLLQRECFVGMNDTVDSLYNGFMYPEGINAMEEAVELVNRWADLRKILSETENF